MKKIFLGNLPFEITEGEIKKMTESLSCDSIVSLPRDRKTGKARGFAFIEIQDDEKLSECIKVLKGQKLKGRSLRVDEVQDKKRGGSSRRDEPENER